MAKSKSESGDQIFRVLPKQVGTTVAASLREWLPDKSWSQIRSLLKSRRVMVSGNLCMDEGRRLRLVDVVKLLANPSAPPPTKTDVKILHLDSQVVVVEKPSGVTSTRHQEEKNWPERRKQLQPTLDEMLPEIVARREGKRFKPTQPGKQGHGRPQRFRPVFAVHRLDRDTSGVMIFARTPDAAKHLEHQFRKHSTGRKYMAVAMGKVEEGRLESSFVRDRGDGIRGSTKLPDVGKLSVTNVRPIERIGAYTLIECRPETGRTHQIRIHLSESGHPLCGEKIYLQPLFKPAMTDRSGAPRLALHAAELEFEHPSTGERMSFSSKFPPDLAEFLNKLRDQANKKAGTGDRGLEAD